ncbi:CvpA family protein [Wenzhouxiangella marina]|uniref:Colicin V production CvpA n=1 Tax=Wenzhouxiangella marina TaxID=1579979 RepID=A0A0K0XXK3_9GAMM|nr:CvpA family protein [Wenzhouxiangella marina]AKS42405.1 colicin V production CvpA [Wenzhouxiangella marina]MBB6085821.1 membrane protein required for colicin V production [Wenzhouxiangella marina]
MNGADVAILAVGLISMLVSLFRGFVREAFSLLVWVAAGYLALRASGPLSVEMSPWISMPSVRLIAAFVGVFVVVLIVGGLCNYLLGKLVEGTGLSGTDRLLGALFGLLRGAAIVLVAVIIARFTPFPNDPWWQQSQLLPRFEHLAAWAVAQFPDSLQEQIRANQLPEADESEPTSSDEPPEPTPELPDEVRAEP